ncbi:enoyl-CoA hydratase/isomerase family protein [Marinivivus vitaminiproducens]|uniref:enoyl-CoA hydratase/isomerase family protein n=1 Tax=Marinivivus vitaminiproducens TaxID=3035935 RepID=UPI00279F70B1|nr:enoyl-CoA hydratase/isomerase family protein [Geminicoccaceae bacterium SCSIO 64248]
MSVTSDKPADPGRVHCTVEGGIARVVFDRPAARNAMTWTMYEQLAEACERIRTDRSIRVATFRGAGGKAFVAGTDIAQFLDFKGGDDGLAYEKRIDAGIERIETLPVPTIAVVEGWAFGGGMVMSAACDFRIATPDAKFGAPIARTLGNCISVANVARLNALFGPARVKRILMLAEAIGAEEAQACGFVLDVVEAAEIDRRADTLCQRLLEHAPITMRSTKEAVRRVIQAGLPDGRDLIAETYGSEDFKTGVRAFLAKEKANWQNR